MKLALVTETFPPEINGVAMTLGQLTSLLGNKGIEVSVFAPKRRDRPEFHNSQVRILQVPGFPIPRYPDLNFGWPALERLRKEWKKDPPHLVHIATEGPLGWSAAKIAYELEINTVSSFHTNFHTYSQHYGFGVFQTACLAWLRHFHNNTLRTFVPSADLIHQLQDQGFKNLRLMDRGVDTETFSPKQRSESLRAEWGAAPHTPVILNVGRMAQEKNLPLVIAAFHKLKKTLPQAIMVFVGDGPMSARVKAALPDAVFTGMQQGQALANCYASADLFLFASLSETFGNVVTEAMASGLPILAFDYAAAQRYIEHGINGVLAPFNDEQSFLGLADWLAHTPAKWKTMGQAARETALPISWNAVVDNYLSELHRITA